jgi:hypothetical protein
MEAAEAKLRKGSNEDDKKIMNEYNFFPVFLFVF